MIKGWHASILDIDLKDMQDISYAVLYVLEVNISGKPSVALLPVKGQRFTIPHHL